MVSVWGPHSPVWYSRGFLPWPWLFPGLPSHSVVVWQMFNSGARLSQWFSSKESPTVQEIQVRSLGQKDPLKKGMPTHSSILAWKIPWTVQPGGLQSMKSQRVGHNWATNTPTGGVEVPDLWSFIKLGCINTCSKPISSHWIKIKKKCSQLSL